MPQYGSWGLPRVAAAYLSSPAIFDLFHSMAHKLITKLLRHTQQHVIFFANLTKKLGMISIHSHWMATVLAAVIFNLAV